MDASKAAGTTPGARDSVGPYTVYSAGGLFTQDELATNVLIKEAVGRLSGGKFQLVLPQSREMEDLDRPDVEAYIRNTDLLAVVKSDIVLARFDGVELDSGTVVEFAVAKSLGKPTVVLRSDLRRVFYVGLNGPYNSMAKNWPRNVDVHLQSFVVWAGLLAEERQAPGGGDAYEATLKAEMSTLQSSVDEIARQIIAGFEAVIEMESPIPPEYQEVVYEALRFSVGSGFDEMLTASEVADIIQRLRANGTL